MPKVPREKLVRAYMKYCEVALEPKYYWMEHWLKYLGCTSKQVQRWKQHNSSSRTLSCTPYVAGKIDLILSIEGSNLEILLKAYDAKHLGK